MSSNTAECHYIKGRGAKDRQPLERVFTFRGKKSLLNLKLEEARPHLVWFNCYFRTQNCIDKAMTDAKITLSGASIIKTLYGRN